jgi:hypothetical protein
MKQKNKQALAQHCADLGSLAEEAMLEKVLHGMPSGRIPLGYVRSLSKDGIEIDILKAPCIMEAFEKVAHGASLRETLAHVTRLGLTSNTGKPLHLSSLQSMLKNPFYCGLIRYKGGFFQGAHDPLVSKTLFDRVQMSLRKRRY